MRKKKLKRLIIKLMAEQRTPEGEWYFDPKIQRAFEGVRGRIASLEKRADILETPNIVTLKRRRA